MLVFDGVFLMRPELIDRWHLRVFVSTALDKTVDASSTVATTLHVPADVADLALGG
ncbi:hypothetical protein GCM10017556_02660 [Micromonospora sagamiensis]|uniref:Uridine kinase n=1 Tax=Micromonospora sagamiensis TaxID=47875 RepID=A0A562WEU2_9ACTN|nr:uridine kinase [Micromonospora sagamiensis]BCL12527.1 hypothetical protein GCM10017556_02660 [Micromonospora sagamiensis]